MRAAVGNDGKKKKKAVSKKLGVLLTGATRRE